LGTSRHASADGGPSSRMKDMNRFFLELCRAG
jgi:hypothetical protein